MNKPAYSSLILLSGALLSAACGSSSSGPSNSGGSGSGNTPTGCVPTPDGTGYVDPGAVGNTCGVVGAWFAYGDGLGPDGVPPGNCQTVGGHMTSECASVTVPAPGGFDNTDGKMCTSGTVEVVLNGSNGMPDYDNMFGAGIGLDFNHPGAGGAKAPFNMDAQNIKGVSFVIDQVPPAKLRVEFPDQATNNKAAAYWLTAPNNYNPSPVQAGLNTILWADVKPPATTVPALDTTAVMGIQFHVPSGSAGAYSFCISELTLIQ